MSVSVERAVVVAAAAACACGAAVQGAKYQNRALEVVEIRPRSQVMIRRCLHIGVRVEILGWQKCGIVGKSQRLLMMIDPVIFTRTRTPGHPMVATLPTAVPT